MKFAQTTHRFLGVLTLFSAAFCATGCDDPEAMLKEQADLVCACDSFDCGMDVLKGPINQKLKDMDKGGKVELSDAAKEHKKRMMGCLLAFKSKEGGADGPTTTAKAPEPAPAYSSPAGKYSVKFPLGAPEEKVSPDQKKIAWNEAKSKVGMYTVSYADFQSPALAQGYVDNFVKTMSREITGNDEVTLGDQKGRELVMKISERATMWVRMFVVDKRVYKVAAGTKNDKPKAYAFLDTFQLSK